MLQRPAVHATFEPAPTEWVQLVPLHWTLHVGPQVPVQVEFAAQLKLHPAVLLEHVSKSQLCPEGQLHDVPAQTLEPQPTANTESRSETHSTTERMRDLTRG